jgi:hypothetical protein
MKNPGVALLAVLCAFTLACGGYNTPATPAAQPAAVPTITALAPNSTTHGDAAFVLTVNGTDFSTTAVINFAGTAQTTNQVSGTQLTATIPASEIENPGTVAVTVTNPGTAPSGGPYGTGGTTAETSSPMNFTIN